MLVADLADLSFDNEIAATFAYLESNLHKIRQPRLGFVAEKDVTAQESQVKLAIMRVSNLVGLLGVACDSLQGKASDPELEHAFAAASIA